MMPVYEPTPFSEALLGWLKGTKCMPKFSRRLANFVHHRKAYRVIRLIPHEKTPDYRIRHMDRHVPLGRVNDRLIYLTNVMEGHPWTTGRLSRSDELVDLRGTPLSTARRDGGQSYVYSAFEPMEDWNWEDITLDFWSRYMEIGKCLFDYKHEEPRPCQDICFGGVADPHHRWIMLDEQTAKCQWCGDVLYLRRSLELQALVGSKWSHNPVSTKATFRCHRCHRPHLVADQHHLVVPEDGSIHLCPSCYIARVTEDAFFRRELLPKELRRSRAIIKA